MGDIQGYVNLNSIKEFYTAIKMVFSLSKAGISPLLSADGNNLITDMNSVKSNRGNTFSNLD